MIDQSISQNKLKASCAPIELLGGNSEKPRKQRRAVEREERNRYLSMSEAEAYLSVSRSTLDRAARRGDIKKIKLSSAISGKVLFAKDSIDAWIESRQL